MKDKKTHPNFRDYRGMPISIFKYLICICGCLKHDHPKDKEACRKCATNKFISCKSFRLRPISLLISFSNIPTSTSNDKGEDNNAISEADS